MFDLLLLIIGVILCLIGIVGSFVPIIPGPMTSWFGLLVLNFTDAVNFNLQFLAITLIIAIIISLRLTKLNKVGESIAKALQTE